MLAFPSVGGSSRARLAQRLGRVPSAPGPAAARTPLQKWGVQIPPCGVPVPGPHVPGQSWVPTGFQSQPLAHSRCPPPTVVPTLTHAHIILQAALCQPVRGMQHSPSSLGGPGLGL